MASYLSQKKEECDAKLRAIWAEVQNSFMTAFADLGRDSSMADVTIACADGHTVRAHKVVLRTCSPYFHHLLLNVQVPMKNTVIILNDIPVMYIDAILDFMYTGEVSLPRENLATFLDIADQLQIKGLSPSAQDHF